MWEGVRTVRSSGVPGEVLGLEKALKHSGMR